MPEKAPAHRCRKCNQDHAGWVEVCSRCGSDKLFSLSPFEYCETYGHSMRESAVESSKRLVPGTGGAAFTMAYVVACSRCGLSRREIRDSRELDVPWLLNRAFTHRMMYKGAMQKWEYLTVFVGGKKVEIKGKLGMAVSPTERLFDSLDELGDQGWEVVGVAASTADLYSVILKRPKQ